MVLFNFFHETEPESAYDKGPIRYFDAYKLTNKGGASYQHFYDSIYMYLLEKFPHWIGENFVWNILS